MWRLSQAAPYSCAGCTLHYLGVGANCLFLAETGQERNFTTVISSGAEMMQMSLEAGCVETILYPLSGKTVPILFCVPPRLSASFYHSVLQAASCCDVYFDCEFLKESSSLIYTGVPNTNLTACDIISVY